VTSGVYLVKGADDVLREQAVVQLVDRLVAGGDRSLLLEEVSGDQYELAAVVDAAQTLPFLTDRRVVVARHLARFSNKDTLAPLLAYLDDPAPTSALVLVWERSPSPTAKLANLPPTLTKAVAAAGGEVITADAPSGRDRDGWVAERLSEAGLRVDGAARRRIVEQLGEDGGALIELAERLVGIHGPRASLGLADVEPFLGEAGGVPPWELTDAIDKGDAALALDKLARMMGGGARHPLQIMATLQGHVGRMVRLDGSGARSEQQAAEILGMKGRSTFAAKKALDQTQKLGSARITRAVGLLAQADLDLRGAQAWPAELVVEVLVARLSALSPSRAARRPSRSGR
jgi:DNA polymerase-3 subunit delta